MRMKYTPRRFYTTQNNMKIKYVPRCILGNDFATRAAVETDVNAASSAPNGFMKMRKFAAF